VVRKFDEGLNLSTRNSKHASDSSNFLASSPSFAVLVEIPSNAENRAYGQDLAILCLWAGWSNFVSAQSLLMSRIYSNFVRITLAKLCAAGIMRSQLRKF